MFSEKQYRDPYYDWDSPYKATINHLQMFNSHLDTFQSFTVSEVLGCYDTKSGRVESLDLTLSIQNDEAIIEKYNMESLRFKRQASAKQFCKTYTPLDRSKKDGFIQNIELLYDDSGAIAV